MTTENANTMEEHSIDRKTKRSSGRLRPFVFWGVLAALVIAAIVWFLFPPYADYTPKAKVAEVLLGTSVAREQVSEFYKKHNRLPRNAAEANISLESAGKIRAMTYDGEKGELRAVIQNIPEVNGKTLILSADIGSGHLEWRCFSDEIPKDFLAGICRRR
jgi:hypothetical protein